MSTISRNSFSLAHMRARGVRQIALLLIMASALLVALYFAATLPVAGAGVLTITSNTGPFAVFDSNKPADQSPGVFTAEAQVCNTGDAPLTDVLLYIGDGTTVGEFPDTTVGGTVYEPCCSTRWLTAMSATVRGTSAIHWHRVTALAFSGKWITPMWRR